MRTCELESLAPPKRTWSERGTISSRDSYWLRRLHPAPVPRPTLWAPRKERALMLGRWWDQSYLVPLLQGAQL